MIINLRFITFSAILYSCTHRLAEKGQLKKDVRKHIPY